MKIWTYQEAMTKVVTDNDLQEIFEAEEAFISPDELIGYFNEALTEAESEIQAMAQDYFLTKYFVPMVQGQAIYDLPDNIFANKIRGIFYLNGSINYPVMQFRRRDKFENIEMTDQYALDAFYAYLLINDSVGQAKMQIHPVSRDTAIMPPAVSAFTPMTMWYIRSCARVPIAGELCNPEVINPTSVNTGANTIAVVSGSKTAIGIKSQGVAGCYPGSIAYITGDAIQFQKGPGGTLPSPLVENTTYYVIAASTTSIKVATTRANALLGTAITLTTAGTVFFTIQVAATTAIINACLLDIPEFTTFVMQWVKCRILEKEKDPSFETAAGVLMAQKKQMVDTLTESIQDDDNEIQGDFSYYNLMS